MHISNTSLTTNTSLANPHNSLVPSSCFRPPQVLINTLGGGALFGFATSGFTAISVSLLKLPHDKHYKVLFSSLISGYLLGSELVSFGLVKMWKHPTYRLIRL